MPKAVKVEIYCKAEDVVVGEVETLGALDATTIVRGLSVKDRARCPVSEVVKDGVQLTCGRCHEPLWFRAADGELYAANPATVKVVP